MYDRRDFLKLSLIGGAMMTLTDPLRAIMPVQVLENQGTQVSLTSGKNRADLAFRALEPFADQIRKDIGNRRVILKVNNVLIYVPLACTHVDTLEGILEFLKSIRKLNNVAIAESTASGSTLEGFDNFGYYSLLSKYPVKLVDLDTQPFKMMYVTDEKDFKPHPIRVSDVILNRDSYVVSVARMKTHSVVGASLSLKNIVFGAPIKDPGFTLYSEDIRFSQKARESKPGTQSDKRPIHGSGFHAVNYNIATLAQRLHPDLAVIDGYIGMEGNGPTLGTPIDHGICVAGRDWLATDRIAIELMGIDFSKIGYLNHCAGMGLGVSDLAKIEVVGGKLKDHIKQYKLHENFDNQLEWMEPLG